MYYFDYASTCPINKKIFNLCSQELENGIFNNPSSTHEEGIKAADFLQKARQIIADILKCSITEIIFTSGGSESDNMALKGIMLKYKPTEAELITSTIEHPAILQTCKQLERFGYKIHYIKPNNMGYISADDIKNKINNKTKLISIMTINNELGTKQNIYEIAHIAHTKGVLFHTDAVQALGKIDLDLSNIDMASFAGHKIGAMKGVGFLYIKDYVELEPLICGGGQESDLRAGTENVFGNYMMALCLKEYYKEWNDCNIKIMNYLQDKIVKSLKEEFGNNIIINSNQLSILNIAFKNINSETLQLMLSSKGDMVSVASACHSNVQEPSYVLKEIGLSPEFQNGSLRISISPSTKEFEVDNLIKNIIFYANHLFKIGKE